jgi:hypothetical protein
MDESETAFTKATLDNLLAWYNMESYKHYFDCFTEAQRMRVVENDVPREATSSKKGQVSYL